MIDLSGESPPDVIRAIAIDHASLECADPFDVLARYDPARMPYERSDQA